MNPSGLSPKAGALARAKRHATGCLLAATLLFALSLVLDGTPRWPIDLLRSVSEAAMVGGLADWFAVAALFGPVTLFGLIPVFPAHTAVIQRNKNRIARSLGDFVRDHFLTTDTLVSLARRHNPARFAAEWFLDARNAERFGRQGTQLLSWALGALQEEKVQALIARTLRAAFKEVDLSRTAGELLEAMLAQGRHHELLDELIAQSTAALREPATRANLAERIAAHLRDEYPKAQLVLPTETIGRAVAGGLARAIDHYLDDVSRQPGHALRAAFDRKANELVLHLKGDAAFARKGDEIKAFILGDARFTAYVRSIWTAVRDMVGEDLRDADSEIHKRLVGAGTWIGTTLQNDQELRASLNRQVEALVERFGPGLGAFVAGHIESTVKGWDSDAMSSLIEQNIGTDLQKIRINGTLIGGLVGGALFAAAYVAERAR